MPFIYRKEIANIDRSEKRDDEFIHKKIEIALEEICKATESSYIFITPCESYNTPFNNADPYKFLVLYATKILDLNLYEVEHWLDNIANGKGIYKYTMPLCYIDEKRKYYRGLSKGTPAEYGKISNCISKLKDLSS